jgi:hypothetical protein
MGLVSAVGAAVVAQEFQRTWAGIDVAKAFFHCFNEHLAYWLPRQTAARPGTPSDDFAITAVLGKDTCDDLPIVAGSLKAIGTPAPVGFGYRQPLWLHEDDC